MVATWRHSAAGARGSGMPARTISPAGDIGLPGLQTRPRDGLIGSERRTTALACCCVGGLQGERARWHGS